MKILMARSLKEAKELASEIHFDVTIEAEYGDTVIEGSMLTLAHHVEGYTSAPALNLEKVEAENILISHIDMDVVVGLISLKDDINPDITKEINYIDTHGQHRLSDVSSSTRNIYDAYNGFIASNRAPFGVQDVTGYLMDLCGFMRGVIGLVNCSPEVLGKYIKAGKAIREERKAHAEANTLAESSSVRVMVTDGSIFGLNSEYGDSKNVIVLNEKFHSITLSTQDKDIDCREAMQSFFGKDAGGHRGIAGTPRGVEYDMEALDAFAHYFLRKYCR